MKEKPLVTVITVTYNSSLYVRDAITSVLAQTYTNFEFIIGDDGSTDGTWDIINGYEDPRFIKYRNDVNIGEYPNRNKAIAMAKGKYIKFIDGDDIIYPHGLEFFVTQLEAFPEAAVAIQKDYTNNILFPALFMPHETIANSVFGTNLLNSSFASDLYRTSELIKVGSLSTKYKTGDADIRYRLAFNYPVLYIAGWVSWPRETPGQASTNLKNGLEIAEYCDYIEKILRQPHKITDTQLLSKIKSKLLFQKTSLILSQIKNFRWSLARQYMKQLGIRWHDLIIHPFQSRSFEIDPLTNYTPARPFRRGFLNRNI